MRLPLFSFMQLASFIITISFVHTALCSEKLKSVSHGRKPRNTINRSGAKTNKIKTKRQHKNMQNWISVLLVITLLELMCQ